MVELILLLRSMEYGNFWGAIYVSDTFSSLISSQNIAYRPAEIKAQVIISDHLSSVVSRSLFVCSSV